MAFLLAVFENIYYGDGDGADGGDGGDDCADCADGDGAEDDVIDFFKKVSDASCKDDLEICNAPSFCSISLIEP